MTNENKQTKWWVPSRKWFVTQVTALTGLLTMYLTTESWDLEESLAAVTIGSQALLAWLVPNNKTEDREEVPESWK